jgi:dihydroorotase
MVRWNKGSLGIGAGGDVTVFDPGQEWIYDRAQSASKSRNSPFLGWRLKGRAVAAIVAGEVVWPE